MKVIIKRLGIFCVGLLCMVGGCHLEYTISAKKYRDLYDQSLGLATSDNSKHLIVKGSPNHLTQSAIDINGDGIDDLFKVEFNTLLNIFGVEYTYTVDTSHYSVAIGSPPIIEYNDSHVSQSRLFNPTFKFYNSLSKKTYSYYDYNGNGVLDCIIEINKNKQSTAKITYQDQLIKVQINPEEDQGVMTAKSVDDNKIYKLNKYGWMLIK